jgi:hypothetical protein
VHSCRGIDWSIDAKVACSLLFVCCYKLFHLQVSGGKYSCSLGALFSFFFFSPFLSQLLYVVHLPAP